MRSKAAPGRRSRANYIPREQGHKLTHVADHGRNVEDHLCRIAVLSELVVHFQPHPQAPGVGHLITSCKKRADWSECVGTLAFHPLAAALELEAPLGVVIVKCITGDELERLFRCYVGGSLPYDHCQFHFPIQLLSILRNNYGIVRTDKRRSRFPKNHLFPTHFLPSLCCMVKVFASPTGDFASPSDRAPHASRLD